MLLGQVGTPRRFGKQPSLGSFPQGKLVGPRYEACAPTLPSRTGTGPESTGFEDVEASKVVLYGECRSMNPEALFAVALSKYRTRDYDGAVSLYRQILSAEPENAGVHYNLGITYKQSGRMEEAIEAYQRALTLKPDFPEAENNLGVALRSAWRIDESIEAFQRAVSLNADFAEAWNNLGVSLRDIGRMDEAVPCFERSIELQPGKASLHGNFLHALHFHPDCDPAALKEEHARWRRQHADRLKPLIPRHENERSAGRRLRIGYVSTGFREHCQSFFTVPLLTHHDRSHYEIFCYSDSDCSDALTLRLRSMTDGWRTIAGHSNEQVAQFIARDRIDILVDLMLHLSSERLLVFARKPAPIQATWLGYPGSTGLDAVDYRLTDPWLDPPGEKSGLYAEQTLRLPHTFWCYDPLISVQVADELPALRKGYVTFGCLNNFSKVNERVLKVWAQVLRTVPRSRLLVMAPRGQARRRVLSMLNVNEDRIEFADFQPRQSYLETYRQIDICLDTFPYNGHTTSLDALWMGVPVISLCGQTPVSRAGLSQAANLGLLELVAQDPEAYVRIASELAHDLPRLAALRASLRPRMAKSPLMNGLLFARAMEDAYRTIWRTWCGDGG